MLLPDDINPENSVYFNGAIILELLQKNRKMEIYELFEKVNIRKAMSFQLFVLCLDWLYLIDAAVLKSDKVELCS